MSNVRVRELSKNVCAMKFMMQRENKKTPQNEEKPDEFQGEEWYLQIKPMPDMISKYSSFTTFYESHDLRYGRMSYGGFNDKLEKMLNEKEESDEEDQEGKDVGDLEMAEMLGGLSKTVGNKLKRKSDKIVISSDDEDDEEKAKKRRILETGSKFKKPKY